MKYFLYCLIGLFSFLAFLLVTAPAAPVVSFFKADIESQVPDLRILAVNGSVWQGESTVVFRDFLPSTVHWDLQTTALLSGEALTDLVVTGEHHDLQARASINADSATIHSATGNITAEYINHIGKKFGFTFSGDLDINQLGLTASNNGRIKDAIGKFHWSGGRVVVDSSSQVLNMVLPPLSGELGMRGQDLTFAITDAGQALIDITLKPDGWAEVAVKSRMANLAGLNMGNAMAPDETVVLIEEKIL